jgi:hypothetical protein
VPRGGFAATTRLGARGGRGRRRRNAVDTGATERFEPLTNCAGQRAKFPIRSFFIDHDRDLDLDGNLLLSDRPVT